MVEVEKVNGCERWDGDGREVGDKIRMADLDFEVRPQKQKFCGDRWSQCDVGAWLGGLGDLISGASVQPLKSR